MKSQPFNWFSLVGFSLRWWSSSCSSPFHSQPCLWLEQRHFSWSINRLVFLLSEILMSLLLSHPGQGLLSLSTCMMHTLQYSSSQQDTLCGSRNTHLHSGHLYWLGTSDINSQSYPLVGAVAIITTVLPLIDQICWRTVGGVSITKYCEPLFHIFTIHCTHVHLYIVCNAYMTMKCWYSKEVLSTGRCSIFADGQLLIFCGGWGSWLGKFHSTHDIRSWYTNTMTENK